LEGSVVIDSVGAGFAPCDKLEHSPQGTHHIQSSPEQFGNNSDPWILVLPLQALHGVMAIFLDHLYKYDAKIKQFCFPFCNI